VVILAIAPEASSSVNTIAVILVITFLLIITG